MTDITTSEFFQMTINYIVIIFFQQFKNKAFGDREQILIASQNIVDKITEYFDTYCKRNERIQRMKKDAMKENVAQAQLALTSGAVAAYSVRWLLTGTLLSAGSGLLSIENVTENVTNFALLFKCENLQLDNVC